MKRLRCQECGGDDFVYEVVLRQLYEPCRVREQDGCFWIAPEEIPFYAVQVQALRCARCDAGQPLPERVYLAVD
jgi:hypothetical protein